MWQWPVCMLCDFTNVHVMAHLGVLPEIKGHFVPEHVTVVLWQS